MRSSDYYDYDDDDFIPEIYHGESVVDRKSVFQGHCARVYNVEHVKIMLDTLKQNKKIENAFHNMYAYRIDKTYRQDSSRPVPINKSTSNIIQDCDDDGEQAAGGRMLTLLQILNVVNVVVVVTRWYGGIQLGPARFKHINNAARDALVKGNFVVKDGPSTSSSGDHQQTTINSANNKATNKKSKANKKRSK